MKPMINSFLIAFSMYSKIPMPKAKWEEENMKYVMCFFPLIGAVIGGLLIFLSSIENILPMSRVFYTVLVVLIPLIITGGIHMDGFLDTTDALSSYQPVEKKLEILKDPHAGAFAMIACVAYYLITFGIWYEVKPSYILILGISFVLSRALSGLAVVTFPLAKNSGLAAMFSNRAKKQVTRITMLVYIAVCAVAMLLINPILGFICMVSAIAVFVYYRHMSLKQFGGITGDLAGYFLQVCELIMTVCVTLGGNLCG